MKIKIVLFIILCAFIHLYSQGAGNSTRFNSPESLYATVFSNRPYLDMGSSTSMNFTANEPFTLECWVKTSDDDGPIIAFRHTTYSNGSIYICVDYEGSITTEPSEKVVARVRADGGSPDVTIEPVSSTFHYGYWHHVALTRDVSGNLNLYQDGTLVGTGSTPVSGAITTNRRWLAYENSGRIPDFGDPDSSYGLQWLNGKIDEVRIWDVERTQAQLREYMNKKLTGNESNLLAYYRLDESSGTTASDSSGNSLHGSLVNMGGDTSWVLSTAALGDGSVYTTTSSNISLTSSHGEQVDVTNIIGTPSFLSLIRIDEAPNYDSILAFSGWVSSVRYWEVWYPSMDSPQYDFIYMYNGHPGIIAEEELKLAYRTDASVTHWSDSEASPDVEQHTLNFAGQSQTRQFILATLEGDNSLPVTLASFEAFAMPEGIRLVWCTSSEINNAGFEILKKCAAEDEYRLVSSYAYNPDLIGLGNSNTGKQYEFLDACCKAVEEYTYQLVSCDFSGEKYTYGPVVAIFGDAGLPEKYEISGNYPNPFNPLTFFKIRSNNPAELEMKVYNVLGELVDAKITALDRAETYVLKWDAAGFPAGIYLYKIRLEGKNSSPFIKTGKMFLMK